MTAVRRRVPRVPRAVLGCTGLFVVLLWASSVTAPLFFAPDEFTHVDLSIAMADGQPYPSYAGRRVSTGVGIGVQPYLRGTRSGVPPHLSADRAPAKRDRPSLTDLGGPLPNAHAPINQLPQHPPLYYQLMGVALRVERAVVPGSGLPAFTTEVAWLRFVNVALLASLPIAAWAFVRRLGGSDRAAVVAAAACLLVPQLTHIGSTVNNDNLLVLLAAWLAVLLAGVPRGDLSVRTAVGIAALATLALLTKGFALWLLPGVAGAYALALLRRSGAERRAALVPAAVALGGSAVFGLAYWVGNWVRYDKLSPSKGADTRAAAGPPKGFVPDDAWFAKRFATFFPERFWGWFGTYQARIPLLAIGLASALLVAALVTALLGPRRSRGGDGGPTPLDLLLALVPAALLLAYVLRYAHSLYVETSSTPFIQGRYLFAAIVPLVGVASLGVDRWLGRRALVVTVAAGLAMHAVGFWTMLRDFWGPDGVGPAQDLHAMVAWSAYSASVLMAATVVAGMIGLASLWLVATGTTSAR